jgi:hypothetical protein
LGGFSRCPLYLLCKKISGLTWVGLTLLAQPNQAAVFFLLKVGAGSIGAASQLVKQIFWFFIKLNLAFECHLFKKRLIFNNFNS